MHDYMTYQVYFDFVYLYEQRLSQGCVVNTHRRQNSLYFEDSRNQADGIAGFYIFGPNSSGVYSSWVRYQ